MHNFIRKRPRLTILLALVLLLILAGWWLAMAFQRKHSDDRPVYGVSFSTKYARELGLDPEEAYMAILEDLNVKKIRLMSYWDLHEAQPGVFNFNDLDRQFEQAKEYQTGISLAIGHRQPRWPECHRPQWADKLDPNQQEQALLRYLEEVIKRYKDHPSLESWQLENEVANRSFGNCPKFKRELVQREYDLVKSLDSRQNLIINASNQSGIPLRAPLGDKAGFSIYQNAHFEAFGKTHRWSFGYLPPAWHSLRAALVESRGRETFVHELQAEPWGKTATVNLSIEEQNQSMTPELMIENAKFAEATGMKEVYLWGSEFWYWRSIKHDDPSFWNTAKSLIKQP